MKKKNTQPYIDYKTARVLTIIYDFINRSNSMRKDMLIELETMRHQLAIMQNNIREMELHFTPLENPNARCTEHEHDIEALRSYAWEMGLTKTLFEKLKDRLFRNRFTGLAGVPVQQEEIKDKHDV